MIEVLCSDLFAKNLVTRSCSWWVSYDHKSLEVCPNCIPGETFAGMAGALPAARILAELPEEERKELAAAYRSRIYEGCGKSLACRNICPAGIDIDRLLASSNAAAVWRRPVRRKKEKYPGQFGKS